MPKIVALDYGSKRVGVAISDPENKIAFALKTISTELVLKYIIDLVVAEKTSVVVIGFPVNLDGSLNDISHEINIFINKLSQKITDITIEKYDERFTSVIAKKTILNSGIGKLKRRNKSLVDKVSATIILQGYLDSLQR
ncbi:Holliday junction resolvase RuvX [Flavobacteriales bacterium]|nr:Holliday junction resolvase RuvX [Flavobacteriales bacterium]MDC1063199.1 Holliday junction resolvase RuvX [Flavobacteriales bacterium]